MRKHEKDLSSIWSAGCRAKSIRSDQEWVEATRAASLSKKNRDPYIRNDVDERERRRARQMKTGLKRKRDM